MLDFCLEHSLTANIELIDMADIETGCERISKNYVRYRLVIDMVTLPKPS